MSRAIFELANSDAAHARVEGVEGSFPFDEAVLEGK
jgi:protein-ribulosamine 3-kinase